MGPDSSVSEALEFQRKYSLKHIPILSNELNTLLCTLNLEPPDLPISKEIPLLITKFRVSSKWYSDVEEVSQPPEIP